MNCQSAKPLLSIYVDGELPLQTQKAIQNHILSCQTCAQEVRDYQNLTHHMQKFLGSLSAPASLEELILAKLVKPTLTSPFYLLRGFAMTCLFVMTVLLVGAITTPALSLIGATVHISSLFGHGVYKLLWHFLNGQIVIGISITVFLIAILSFILMSLFIQKPAEKRLAYDSRVS